jgi:hypothetical protein
MLEFELHGVICCRTAGKRGCPLQAPRFAFIECLLLELTHGRAPELRSRPWATGALDLEPVSALALVPALALEPVSALALVPALALEPVSVLLTSVPAQT